MDTEFLILNFILWNPDSRHCPGAALKDRQEAGDIEIIQMQLKACQFQSTLCRYVRFLTLSS